MVNKVVVYSKPNCSYCDMLKSFLNDQDLSYELKDVSNAATLMELKRRAPGVKTAPQMFVNDFLVGGARDSIEFFRKMDKAVIFKEAI